MVTNTTGAAPGSSLSTRAAVSYYGWVVVGLTLLFQAMTFGSTVYIVGLMVVPWSESLGVSRAQILLAPLLFQVGSTLFSPFAGRALDKWPARWIVFIGTGLLAAGLALMTQVSALWHLLALFAGPLAMASVIAGNVSAQTLAARWFVRRRGLALGITAVGSSLGGLFLPPLLAALFTEHHWRIVFGWLAIVVMVVLAPTVWIVLRREPQAKDLNLSGEVADGDVAPALVRHGGAHDGPSTGAILSNHGFWTITLPLALLLLVYLGLQHNLPSYVSDRGFTPQQAALLISVISAISIFGKLMFGALSDRIDYRLLYAAAAVVCIPSLIILMTSASYSALVVAAVGIGLAGSGIQPLLGAMLAKEFGVAAIGRVLGLAIPVLGLSAFSPSLVGIIYQRTGSYNIAFSALMGVLVLGTSIAALHRRRNQVMSVASS
jgi:MFS family permease